MDGINGEGCSQQRAYRNAVTGYPQGNELMVKRLVLVDFENVQKLDLSILDESYRAIVFVGASQAPPKAARNKATAHRFSRVDFQKIEGNGKNALDFHIAFHLGRTFETAPETECIVLSKDKGYDPLLVHLNKKGLICRRIISLDELLPEVLAAPAVDGSGVKWFAGVAVSRARSSTMEASGARTAVRSRVHPTRSCFRRSSLDFGRANEVRLSG